jgi:hypothetical protein
VCGVKIEINSYTEKAVREYEKARRRYLDEDYPRTEDEERRYKFKVAAQNVADCMVVVFELEGVEL